jgi:hypothetical protein
LEGQNLDGRIERSWILKSWEWRAHIGLISVGYGQVESKKPLCFRTMRGIPLISQKLLNSRQAMCFVELL